MRYHITPISSNQKTGPIPVTTTGGQSCPPSCPFQRNGCYASGGPTAIHWGQVTDGKRGDEFTSFLAHLGTVLSSRPARQLWRHNQAGDLPGVGDRIDRVKLRRLVDVNATYKARGWTYTHKPVLGRNQQVLRNREAVAEANANGFTINLSGNNLRHADQLAALGIAPVATVVPAGTGDAQGRFVTPKGRKGIVCPAQRGNVTCETCGLCAVASLARPIVGFIPHGSGAKRVQAVAEQ